MLDLIFSEESIKFLGCKIQMENHVDSLRIRIDQIILLLLPVYAI